jgi:DNA-directed RNA polymerase specialized sigma24 family protein
MKSLSEGERLVIEMRMKDIADSEIAIQLNTTTPNIRVRYFRALNKLREILASREKD